MAAIPVPSSIGNRAQKAAYETRNKTAQQVVAASEGRKKVLIAVLVISLIPLDRIEGVEKDRQMAIKALNGAIDDATSIFAITPANLVH